MDDLLLDYAREVYNSDSFSLFQHEYEKSRVLSVDATEVPGPGHDFKYEVKRATDPNHSYKVTAGCFGEKVECCCNRFQVTGILCSHALAVLRLGFMDIRQVSNKYLLKWRMKTAKQAFMRDTPPLKRLRLMKQHRRIYVSSDNCLRGGLGRSWINANAKKEIKRIRPNDLDDDDDKCEGVNHLGSPLLRHAKEIYTSKAYKSFKSEYRKSEYLLVVVLHKAAYARGLVYEFQVSRRGGVAIEKVYAEARNGTIKCSCKMFDKSRILCSHALAVYDNINKVRIPSMSVGEKIHGRNYVKMLTNAVHMIKTYGRTSRFSGRGFGEGEERADALEEELRELSQQEEFNEERRASSNDEMVGKVRFYDDHLIKYSYFQEARIN